MSGYFYTEKPSETDFSLVEKVIPFVKQFKEVTKYAVSFKKKECVPLDCNFTQDFIKKLNMQLFYITIFLYCRLCI